MAKIRKGDKVVVLTGHERDEKPVVIGTASPDHDAAVSEKGAKAAAKTIVVKVERRYTHPLLKKPVRRGKSYGGHKVLSVMTDGTPLLEAVAKPTIFTKEQISDTIRNVMAERMAKTPTRYAG